MANRNYLSSRVFNGHAAAVYIDCNFTVANADSAGLGITGLVGPYVQNVFMHTTQTPGAGNSAPNSSVAVTNPNPAAGIIIVQLMDSYYGVYENSYSIQSPNSGTPIVPTGINLTVGNAYVITALGAMTRADWIALGVPAGITPAIGVSFIAKATGATSGGTSAVQAPSKSGIYAIEIVGDENLLISPKPIINQGFGGEIILQCLNASGTLTAPANGSKIRLKMLLSNSSVQLQGE